jgi:hypothetical protein
VPTGDANVNGFLAGRNIGEAQSSETISKTWWALNNAY